MTCFPTHSFVCGHLVWFHFLDATSSYLWGVLLWSLLGIYAEVVQLGCLGDLVEGFFFGTSTMISMAAA